MNVLQLLPSLRGGGVEQGTVDVCAALVANGHRAIVISDGGPMVQAITAVGGEHIQWPIGHKSLLTFRLVPRLRHLIRERQIDILHPRSRLPAWIAWLAWRSMNRCSRPKFITTVHGFYSTGLYSSVMTRGERVICVSKAIEQYVHDNYPQVPAFRLRVIARGIDPALYPHTFKASEQWLQQWRLEYPQLQRSKVILLPGRLTRLKGHQELINLIADFTHQGFDVHGVIAGGVDPRRTVYANSLKEQVQRAGLGARIHFVGHRNDLREWMSVSDLVLSLSSKPESFGRTVLEAVSLGRPVLGYAHGGVAEVLQTLYPSGLTPVGDRQQLLIKATALLNEPVPVAPVNTFTLQQMLRSTLALYDELLTLD